MDIDSAIASVNARHVYTPDGTRDNDGGWDINPVGDCEDYSFAVVWEYAGGNWPGFARAVLFGPFQFWHVRIGGQGHFVTQIGDDYLDNNFRKRVSRETMERIGYDFRYTRWRLIVLLKVILT